MPVSRVVNDAQLGRLAGTRFGPLVQMAETASTNSVLGDEGRRGAAEGLVVVADHQTAGRGRFQRKWESPPGQSLLFSVLLRPHPAELPLARRHLVAAAVSLALAEGAAQVAGVDVALKWPNDLIGTAPEGGEAKVAGVLAESQGGAIVVGAGVNVAWAPPGVGATSLQALAGGPVDRGDVLVASLLALDRLYGHWEVVSERYRHACATVGRGVTVSRADGAPDLTGTAVALDNDGRLVVRDGSGALVTVAAGDVRHVRPPRPPSLAKQ